MKTFLDLVSMLKFHFIYNLLVIFPVHLRCNRNISVGTWLFLLEVVVYHRSFTQTLIAYV